MVPYITPDKPNLMEAALAKMYLECLKVGEPTILTAAQMRQVSGRFAQGYGAGVGDVGRFREQGNWYRGGVFQMLFGSWLYGVQNTQRPRLPDGLSREDIVRLSKYFDLAPAFIARFEGDASLRDDGTAPPAR